jgi:hypothetical protein
MLLPSILARQSLLPTHIGWLKPYKLGLMGQMPDPEEAITFHRDTLALRPPGHPNRSLSLVNLAIAMQTRFEQTG